MTDLKKLKDEDPLKRMVEKESGEHQWVHSGKNSQEWIAEVPGRGLNRRFSRASPDGYQRTAIRIFP